MYSATGKEVETVIIDGLLVDQVLRRGLRGGIRFKALDGLSLLGLLLCDGGLAGLGVMIANLDHEQHDAKNTKDDALHELGDRDAEMVFDRRLG